MKEENLQIIINISEERYKRIKEQVDKRDYPDMQIGRAIVDGILIPECYAYKNRLHIPEEDYENRVIGVGPNHPSIYEEYGKEKAKEGKDDRREEKAD